MATDDRTMLLWSGKWVRVTVLGDQHGEVAWVLTNPAVSAPSVGATKPHHLPEAVAALDMNLSNEEISALEEHYTPHGLSWF
jgi:predicted oxidoreductase